MRDAKKMEVPKSIQGGQNDIFLSKELQPRPLKEKKKAYNNALRGAEENALVFLSSLLEGRILGEVIEQEMTHFGMTVPTFLVKSLDQDSIMENFANTLQVL